MRKCIEDQCDADISHKGNRAKRCDEHQRAFHAAQERSRYGRVKDAISTRRVLRRQGAAEYEPPEELEVIDYTRGDPLPGMRPLSRRSPGQHWTHDHATRVQRLRAMQESGEGEELSSWDAIQQRAKAPGHRVMFPPAPGSPAASGGFSSYDAPRPPDFPDVAGELYRPGPAINTGANGHLFDRWGNSC
jgi:hypothetical protein